MRFIIAHSPKECGIIFDRRRSSPSSRSSRLDVGASLKTPTGARLGTTQGERQRAWRAQLAVDNRWGTGPRIDGDGLGCESW